MTLPHLKSSSMKTVLNFFSPYHYGKHGNQGIPKSVISYLGWPMQTFKISFVLLTMFTFITLLLIQFGGNSYSIIIALVLGAGLLITVAYNVLTSACLVVFCITDRKFLPLILQKSSILLLNIPITFLYINIINIFN